MTSNGVASGGVQVAHSAYHERMAERAALRRNDDVQERHEEDTQPVTEPAPPLAYNGKGKLVPSPALAAVDLSM